MNVDLSPATMKWAMNAGFDIRQGSTTHDRRTVLSAGLGEVRRYIAPHPSGWLKVTESHRMRAERVVFLAASLPVVEAYLVLDLAESNRDRSWPQLAFPPAPLQTGWSIALLTSGGATELALYDRSAGRLVAVHALGSIGEGTLAGLSVVLEHGIDAAQRSLLDPEGAPLFPVNDRRREAPDEIPDFAAEVDIQAAAELYRRGLTAGGVERAQQALVDEYGPALALFVRRKVRDLLAGSPPAWPAAPSVIPAAPQGERAAVDIDDIVALVLSEPGASTADWDRVAIFTHFGEGRNRTGSDFLYKGDRWTPGFVDEHHWTIVGRLDVIRDEMAQSEPRRWNAAVITVDRVTRKGALHVFYGDEAEFWIQTPSKQKSIAQRGHELAREL